MSFSALFFFYIRNGVCYRDLEAIMDEICVKVDHSILNRWAINYSSSLVLMVKKLNAATLAPEVGIVYLHPPGRR